MFEFLAILIFFSTIISAVLLVVGMLLRGENGEFLSDSMNDWRSEHEGANLVSLFMKSIRFWVIVGWYICHLLIKIFTFKIKFKR